MDDGKEVTTEPAFGAPPCAAPPAHALQRPPRLERSWSLSIVSATLAALIGATVLVGWRASSEALVRVHESFPPMQPATALGLLLCGLGLAFTGARRRLFALAGGILALAGAGLGAVNLIALISDPLARSGWPSSPALGDAMRVLSAPMSPHSAICFVVSGVATAGVGLFPGRGSNLLVPLGGGVIATTSALALIGYASDMEGGYRWGGLTGMAVHTAAGSLLLANGLYFLSRHRPSRHIWEPPPWLPNTALILGIATTLLVATSASRRQHDRITARARLQAAVIASGVEQHMTALEASLQRAARRMLADPGSASWDTESADLFARFSELETLALRTGRGELRWPRGHAPALPPQDLEAMSALAGSSEGRDGLAVAFLSTERAALATTDLEGAKSESVTILAIADPRELCLGWYRRGVSEGQSAVGVRTEAFTLKTLPPASAERIESARIDLAGQPVWISVPHAPERTSLADLVLVPGIAISLLAAGAIRLTARLRARTGMLSAEIRAKNAAAASREAAMVRLQESHQHIEELNRQLEISNTDLDEFAHVVSHDLKAPLRAISTLTQWIAAENEGNLSDEGKENVSLLLGRTARLSGLIDGILSYSRAARTEARPRPIPSEEVVREAVASLTAPAELEVRVTLPLPTVVYDRAQLGQVLQNLIQNAIQHTPPPGTVEIACAETATHWEFSVSDTGIGIEAHHLERVFDVFTTLRPRDDVEARGIGLATVKKLVERNRGRVWVESEPGHGSVFCFTIPKAPPGGDGAAPAA